MRSRFKHNYQKKRKFINKTKMKKNFSAKRTKNSEWKGKKKKRESQLQLAGRSSRFFFPGYNVVSVPELY
jgi:hypothetical protein